MYCILNNANIGQDSKKLIQQRYCSLQTPTDSILGTSYQTHRYRQPHYPMYCMSNHRVYGFPVAVVTLLAMFTWGYLKSALKSVFWDIMYLSKFGFLSTTSPPWKYYPETISINSMSRDSETQGTCERAEHSDWRRMQFHDFRTIWLKTQVNSRYLCIFVKKKTNKCQHMIIWITIIYL